MSNGRFPLVVLARHGETPWSLTGQHTGRTDLPLTERGEEEGRRLAARLERFRWKLVLSSPLERARRTCELAGAGGRMIVEPDLSEWDYGQYEGRRTEEIQRERPGWNLFRDGCPGGETAEEVGSRADRVVERVRAAQGDVVLFGHGHQLRVVAARWTGRPAVDGRLFVLATATLSVLGYDHGPDEPVITRWNDDGRARLDPA